jgi:hypothetical protein
MDAVTGKSSFRSAAIVILAFFLSACAPAAPTMPPTAASPAASALPSSGPMAADTQSIAPAAPSQTPALEPAATAALPSHGPYYAFYTYQSTGSILTLIGANGAGRKDIPLPEDARMGSSFSSSISPDGEWLAFWTGWAGFFSDGPLAPDEDYDLQLNLFHVSDGTILTITGLLSPDYPANFEKNAQALKGGPEFSGDDISVIIRSLQWTFLGGIESGAWSPDGRHFAFAGERDGPSSDLYDYEISTKVIRRLSDGRSNIVDGYGGNSSVTWSPDGKWIVYSGAYWAGEGMAVQFHAARPDDSDHRDFNWATVGMILDWLSPSDFLTIQTANGMRDFGLERTNIDTGRVTEIWKCSISGYFYDPQEDVFLILNGSGPAEMGCKPSGVYAVYPSSGKIKNLFDEDGIHEFPQIGFLGRGDRRFLIHMAAGTYALSPAGEKTLITNADLVPFISPDRQWVALAGAGLRMMDATGTMSEFLTEIKVDNVEWRPDSKGFIFNSGPDLYFVSMPDQAVSHADSVQYPSDVKDISWQPDSKGFFFLSGSGLYFLSLAEKSLVSIQVLEKPNSFEGVWVAAPE